MIQGAHLATIAAMTEAEIGVVAYLEAADGDVGRALLFAVEDLIKAERERAEACRAVSRGYLRAPIASSSTSS